MPQVETKSVNITYKKTEDIGTFGSLDKLFKVHKDCLQPGEVLNPCDSLISANGQYTFVYEGDGNLVLFRNSDNQPLWTSNTRGKTNGMCIMHGNGNFVIYDWNANPVWSSGTWQHPGSHLVVESNGDVVIYNPDGTPVWAINT
ncbi:hypothetical protein DSM106972_049050 [Dulcicalothrix desertica PCC 7102]|uniref:Bulb-type lectin domain-containing protein n=1 Tax=Dulcicalothrix desertica PCC 7102 TaxID=232991 RepID=A0A433VD01_9CYAN|nr:lectin [Dulcicalothrix desertica]RUT03991.1 hypothetical protein DSM106972_049050 [Dulcicalothrix desertica PCC 7102]TWH43603.1 D-mannose binding lectin [Dulcicalothrix desertica PCC 7102]